MKHVDDAQRRIRIARRHAIAPDHRVASIEDAVTRMVCLHATESPSAHLAAAARTDLPREAVEQALYVDRSVVKQLAMRRTLFVFPRDLLPAVWGSASARVSAMIGPRLAKDVELAGLADDGTAWLDAQVSAVEDALVAGPATTTQLRGLVPELDRRMDLAPGKTYSASPPVANRVLTQAAVSGRVLRGDNDGGWRANRPLWVRAEQWLGESPEPWAAVDGWRELVRRWLWTFGPGTESDIVWWLGATKGIVRAALASLEAVEVSTSSGPAYLLPDDVDDLEPVDPWVALLPVLDPTLMGWKERDFYLGEHRPRLFDVNGNGGSTIWVDGRVVGGWWQDPDGVVHPLLLEDVGSETRAAIDVEASRLTDWIGGEVVGSAYHSPVSRQAMAG